MSNLVNESRAKVNDLVQEQREEIELDRKFAASDIETKLEMIWERLGIVLDRLKTR